MNMVVRSSILFVYAYRAAANAVSYLTRGPHFGGEPLSVYLLHHQQGVSVSTAAASVALDRLLELLASFVVLTLCLLVSGFWNQLCRGLPHPLTWEVHRGAASCLLFACETYSSVFSAWD